MGRAGSFCRIITSERLPGPGSAEVVGSDGAASRNPGGNMLQTADLTIRLNSNDDVVIARVDL